MDDVTPEPPRHHFTTPTRRTFLLGSAGAGALLFGLGGHDGSVRQIDSEEMVGNPTPLLTFDVVRAQDALVMSIQVFNMTLEVPVSGQTFLTKYNADQPAYIVAVFPDQSVGEQAVPLVKNPYNSKGQPQAYDFATDEPVDINGYRAHAFDNVQPTRLAFEVYGDLNPSLQPGNGRSGLLDWLLFVQSTGPGIPTGAGKTPYTAPSAVQTSIGAPFNLALAPAPVVSNGWIHSTEPVIDAGSGITEIWHTRLGTYVQGSNPPQYVEYPDGDPKVNAVFSNNFAHPGTPGNFANDTDGVLVPIDVVSAADIVLQTSDYADYGSKAAPVDVHRLMLTSNGAWLDLHGTWVEETGNTLIGWSQKSTHGRDHEVVLSNAGYLLPFGHPVTLITRNTRRFETAPTGSPVANIRQNTYLIIRKQDLDLTAATLLPRDGRAAPFKRVRLNATVTPNLVFTDQIEQAGSGVCSGAAWCMADASGNPYMFNVTAWDWEDNPVSFSVPMAFVNGDAATGSETKNQSTSGEVQEQNGSAEVIAAGYNSYAPGGTNGAKSLLVTADLGGKPIAMAPSSTAGNTTVRVDSMIFGAAVVAYNPSFLATDSPRLFPTLQSANVRIPAVQTVSPSDATQVEYHSDYLASGFVSQHPGELFLHVDGQSLNFDNGGNGTHPGVITPNITVTGLSRSRGLVGGIPNSTTTPPFDTGTFNPTGFFDGAKLLGGLDLVSIIAQSALAQAPLINAVRNYPETGGVPDLTQPPTITTTISWTPDLQQSSPNNPVFIPGEDSTLNLSATIVATPGGAPPTTDVTGQLTNFTLQLFGDDTPILTLVFDEFTFHSHNGAKPTVKPQITSSSFDGPLSFINTREQFLPSGPGGSGITVTPTQVTASTSIAIPSVGIGVFSLTNLSFNAAVDIPFTGDPARVRFSFCTRDQPFLLSVLIFGGGGFVGVALGTDGMEMLEGSFEFGACMGIDIGIASASVEVMAGIYFSITTGSVPSSQASQLTGFVKATGELNLAVVAVTLTFYLSLTYEDQDGSKSAWGEVDVSLDVRVLIFSVTIHFSVRKQFAGGGDPNFLDMYTPDQWTDYALAFG
jgi:hypothetical protein